jgi:hypothetical protein
MAYEPLDDAQFRRLLAGLIEDAPSVEEDKTLYVAMSFKQRALLICKKLGLTRTCALLERNL